MPSASHSPPATSAASSSALPSASAKGAQPSVNQLRKLLGQNQFQPSQSDEVREDLAQLSALMHELGIEPARAALPAGADEPLADEVVVQEMVRMIVDNLCHDQRLLPSVRDWVASLEPSLLALSAVDVRFLSDEQHPARLMLDQVTARSLGFADEAAAGFRSFFGPVQVACKNLKPHALSSSEPFARAWQSIEHAWSQQKSDAHGQRELAMQALVQVEQRNLLAEKIALEIIRRDDARQAPIFVKQFVASAWSQVLAQARLNPASQQAAQRYLDILPDLYWSVVPEEAAQAKSRLVGLIPSLLATVREGLASIGSPEHQAEAFFSQLMQVHQMGLKASVLGRGFGRASEFTNSVLAPAYQTGAQPLGQNASMQAPSAASEMQRISQAADAVWLAPQEARTSGFMDDLEPVSEVTQPMQYESQAPLPVVLEPTQESDGLVVMEPPKLGSWVEFLSNEQWVRAQLTWASPHGTLFMCTGAAGNPYSMTRRALDKLQARQALRIIAEESVMAGALSAVAHHALNSAQ